MDKRLEIQCIGGGRLHIVGSQASHAGTSCILLVLLKGPSQLDERPRDNVVVAEPASVQQRTFEPQPLYGRLDAKVIPMFPHDIICVSFDLGLDSVDGFAG